MRRDQFVTVPIQKSRLNRAKGCYEIVTLEERVSFHATTTYKWGWIRLSPPLDGGHAQLWFKTRDSAATYGQQRAARHAIAKAINP